MALNLHTLLSKGYFPKELPPPFNTMSYADALAGPVSAPPLGHLMGIPLFSMPYKHNLVRAGGLRRNLGIPNPKHFFRLAAHITQYWQQLSAFASTSPFSLTKPIDTNPDRAISPQHSLDTRTLESANLRATAKYILKADISRFFPSIYTHSLPWALMGKPAAKAAHANKTLHNTWQDKCDAYSRGIMNNQTIGIPIGPDTSRLLAEVILARVDINLKNKLPKLNGFRYIDDYEFAFSSRSESDEALAQLQHCLNEFELALNPNKTSIIELPHTFNPSWLTDIRTFEFRKAGVVGEKNDLTAYFDLVFNLFKQYPQESMLKYSIARLNGIDVDIGNWGLLENLLCHSSLNEPACLSQVCDQLFYYLQKGYPINKKLWENTLNRIVTERVPLGQVSEATWAMWIMKLLSITLAEASAFVVAGSDDSTTGLMALGLASVGLANPLHLKGLHAYASASGLMEEQWLLSYQGNYLQWLGPNSGHHAFAQEPLFDFLATNKVSFFDINTAHPISRRGSFTQGAYGGGY